MAVLGRDPVGLPPAIHLTQVQHDPPSILAEYDVGGVEFLWVQPIHRRGFAVRSQPGEEVQDIQSFTAVERLGQFRGHARFSATQLRQARQDHRHIQDHEVMTRMRGVQVADGVPLGLTDVLPEPITGER